MKKRLVVAAVAVLLSSGWGASRSFAKDGACSAEMNKFCKDVAAGQGRIVKCLQEHDADLSEKCRAYANTASMYVACLDDVVRLCPKAQPGTPQVLVCLRTHADDLSTECKNELGRIKR